MWKIKNVRKNPKGPSNINEHALTAFESFIFEGLKSGGVHIVANKSHGKSRLMFSMAETLRNQPNVRTIIFDWSETWLYAFSKIETFTISEHDITEASRDDINSFEKYQLRNWLQVKLALSSHKDLLFRLKTRKPSKRGFFIRTIVNYLDALQRIEKAKTVSHEPTQAIAFFVEEVRTVLTVEAQQETTQRNFSQFLMKRETTKKPFSRLAND